MYFNSTMKAIADMSTDEKPSANNSLPQDLRANIAPHCKAIAAWLNLREHASKNLSRLFEPIEKRTYNCDGKGEIPSYERYQSGLPVFSAKLAAHSLLSAPGEEILVGYFDPLFVVSLEYWKSQEAEMKFESKAKLEETLDNELDALLTKLDPEMRALMIGKIRSSRPTDEVNKAVDHIKKLRDRAAGVDYQERKARRIR